MHIDAPFEFASSASPTEQFLEDCRAMEERVTGAFFTEAGTWVSMSFPESEGAMQTFTSICGRYGIDLDECECERNNPEKGDILYYIDKDSIR